MAQQYVFEVGKNDLDADLMQDLDEIRVEEFEGKTFDQLPRDQKDLFQEVVKDLKTVSIADDPDVDSEENIDRLIQIAKVLQLAFVHADHQQQRLQQANDELQAEMTRRDETDPIALLTEVQQKDNENQKLQKRITALETRLDEGNEEIKRLESNQAAEKERIVRLEEDLRAANEKKQRADQENRDLRGEMEQLRKNRADNEQADERDFKLEQQIQREKRKADTYQRTQKDLQFQIADLAKQFKALQQENDEDKAKLVELYDSQSTWKSTKADLESKVEDLEEDREMLQDKVEELKEELEEKIELLEELTQRFERQYGSWEQEREALMGQMAAMEKGNGMDSTRPPGVPSLDGRGGSLRWMRSTESPEESVEALREELRVVREEQVLLMEAYEALEKDMAKEVEKALEEQEGKLAEANSLIKVMEKELAAQGTEAAQLQEQVGQLEQRVEEAENEAEKFLSGNYGLSDAVYDAKLLKERLRGADREVQRRVEEVNTYASKLDEALEENLWLKRKAGLPEDISIDLKDVRLVRQGQMMQVKAMNAMLEEENMRLEEDVRRLKHEVRFRTKWEGMNAAGLGLTTEQLQLLELKAEQIKYGRVDSRDDELLRLHKRIQYLELRLAEAQAMASIPEDMRDFKSSDGGDAIGGNRQGGKPATSAMVVSHRQLLAASEEALAAINDAMEILPSRHADVLNILENARAALKKASDKGRKAAAEDDGTVAQSLPASPNPGASTQSFNPGTVPASFFMTDVLADAQAEKLREKLKQMASQLAELHSIAEQKNAMLEVAEKEKSELARRLRAGGAGLLDGEGVMVTKEEYAELRHEADALKVQLVECLEEQSLKEREINAISQDLEKYRQKFQGFEDQKRLLYREYVREWQTWRKEKEGLQGQVSRLQADRDEAKAAAEEYKRGLEAIQRGTEEEVRAQYGDAVRRMALAAMRSARLARELESSLASEKNLNRERAELEAEIADMSSTLRTRMRYLERSKEAADRRIGRLYRELEASIPCQAYEMLAEKYSGLQRTARKRMEESAETVLRDEDLLNLRDEVAELTKQVFELVDECGHLKEEKRQAERRARGSGPPAGTATAVGLGSPSSSAIRHPATVAGGGGSHPEDVAELVKLRVEEGNARKRAELEARKAARAAESEAELKARLGEVEKQLADSASELHAAMESNRLYRERLESSLPRREAASLHENLEIFKAATSEAEASLSEWKQRARQMEEAQTRDKRSHMLQMATITQLRTALREIASSTDAKAAMAKLHEEINHVRSKEACIRNQLIRSEQERNKLQDENSSLRRELGVREAALAAMQDAAHFASRERHELLGQLQAGIEGRVEAWRAERWRRKLDDVKGRNDILSGDLDVARRRVLRLEERAEKAELERDAVASLEEVLSRPMAEAFRQCAHLTEAGLHQRLETSKVKRELGLQTEKVRYQERVIAELEARLEEYEAEAFRSQSALEAERMDLLGKIRGLEEQLLSLGSKAAEEDGGVHGAREAGLRASAADIHHAQRRRAERFQFLGRAVEDRETMLDQVERERGLRQELAEAQAELKAAKQALTDAEYTHGLLKVEYEDLVAQMGRERERRLAGDEALSAVERKQDQGTDATLQQVRAVAEKRISALERRLEERDREVKEAGQRMDEMRAQYLLQHERDREEIERLNDALHDRNERTISAMRENANLSKAINNVVDESERTMTYDQLQRLLDQRDRQLEEFKNKLEQIQRQFQLAAHNHKEEVGQKDELLAELNAEVVELRRATQTTRNRNLEVNNLKKELNEKKTLLKELGASLKKMEASMIHAEQQLADQGMRKLSLEEREQLDKRYKALEKDKSKVEQQLRAAQKELDEARSQLASQAQQHGNDMAELENMRTKLDEAQRDLTRERKKVRELKNQRDTTGTLNAELMKPDPKVAGVLENRVKVLEAQNARLRAAVGVERGPLEEAAANAVADEVEMNRARRMLRASEQQQGGGGGGGGGNGGGGGGGSGLRASRNVETPPADYAGSDQRVKQWEENKKLKDRIQKLREVLSAKDKAMEDISKERDRRAGQVVQLQEDLRRTKEMLAAAQRSGGAGAGGQKVLSEPQKMRELVAEANAVVEERDRLALEVERLRLRLEKRQVAEEQGRAEMEEDEEDAAADREAALFEMRLERDHAQAQVARLKGQLEDLFGQQPSLAAAGLKRPGSSKKGGASAREAELEATIDALHRALDRATREAKLSVPNTKYMALLEKKKAATKQLIELQASSQIGTKAQTEVKALEMRCSNLEESNAALRHQLKETKVALDEARQSDVGGQLRAAQAALQSKDTQLRTLQSRIRQLEREAAGGQEVAALRRALEEAEAENEDLKTELNAFDPAFFEEIEDLKHEHHELGIKVGRYETVIRDFSRQLGVAPPL